MARITIVVPTYWTWESGTPLQSDDIVYDHPTPLDQPGTLARLLESLSAISHPEFNVVVITAATNSQLEAQAEAKVEEIIAPFRDAFPIAQFASSDLSVLHRRIERLGFRKMASLISLRGYGNVRNIQLIVPHLLGSEVIVALDDDEVVEPDYLMTATEFIGAPAPDGSGPILGLAGYYLDEDGNEFSEVTSAPDEPNLFRRKDALMNAGLELLEEKPGRVVPSVMAFGGNMVFTRPLWARVSFDPWITRGEDMDYLINARFQGIGWWLDKEATIVHLPPGKKHGAHSAPSYSRLEQDVRRFIYETEKIEAAKREPGFYWFDPAELDPYPGAFLHGDVATHALDALSQSWPPDELCLFPSPSNLVADAVYYARESAPRYFAFAREWPRLMAALADDRILQDHFRRKLGC